MKKKCIFLVLFAALFFNGTAFSQSDEKKFGEEQSQSKKTITLATELKNYGLSNNNPIFLISAAQILIDNPIDKKQVADKIEDKGGTTTNATKKETEDIELNAKALLGKAKSMAGKDKEVLAMVAKVETNLQNKKTNQATTKGATYYNGYYQTFKVYKTKWVYITFTGGELAEIVFIGDGDTDVDFYVYDEDGNFLDKDVDYTDEAGWSWYPRYTQQYRFKMVNRGNVYNKVTVITN